MNRIQLKSHRWFYHRELNIIVLVYFALSMSQVQHRAGLAAAMALLWPVSSQPGSSEARSEISGVTAQRDPGFRLSAANAELSEVCMTCCALFTPITHRRHRVLICWLGTSQSSRKHFTLCVEKAKRKASPTNYSWHKIGLDTLPSEMMTLWQRSAGPVK